MVSQKKRSLPITFAAIAALLSSALPMQPVSADALDTPIPVPQWTKTVGTLRVEKFGAGEPALILVPGLACGSWVYRDTIAREAGTHAIYAVTLAGFDGLAYDAAADTLDAADTSLATLIEQENITKPVLVGHSMGGFLALRFGSEHPELLRSVVSIDGPTILPDLAMSTPKQIVAFANGFAKDATSSSEASYAKQNLAFQKEYVTSPALAAKVAALTLRSDRAAVGAYGKALFLSDLRSQMASLTLPVMFMVPIPSLPVPEYYAEQVKHENAKDRETDIVQVYGRLMAGAPRLTMTPIQKSRHFVMLDQPDVFIEKLDAFIASP